MAIRCGVRDGDGVSDFYKAFLSQEIIGIGSVIVVGYVSEETTISLMQLWNSPFQGDTIGNAGSVEKLSSLTQSQTSATSTSQLNSKLIWEGGEALEFSLPLQFFAYADAKIEVDDPIQYFMQMSSPELNDVAPMGQRPILVDLDLGRKIKAPVFIKGVEYDTNAPRTNQGYFAHNRVTLQCVMDGGINSSQVPLYFQ